MTSNSASARDIKNMLHGYVELATLQQKGVTVITGGKGIYVFDENGTPYIEGAAGMWCTAFGFGEQELIDAAIEQFHKLPFYHTCTYKSVNPAIDLAERIAGQVPIRNAKVYFSLSGSEGNDFLVKVVRYYNNARGRPAKKKIIGRINGYHGHTIAAASLTGISLNHRMFDLPMDGISHVSDPNYFRNALAGESKEAFVERLAAEFEGRILEEGPETVAAFIAEPVTGAGGVVIPPPGYYEKIRAICDKYEVLLLDDEVIAGFHRTGELWGCQTMGFVPDTMTLAKGLTSAYQPLAATVLSEEIYDGLELGSSQVGFFSHGATYSGHPVACAVALRVFDLLEQRGIAAHVKRVGAVFRKRLEQLRAFPYVGDVRCVGLMGAVEFVASAEPRTYFQPVGSFGTLVRDRAEEGHRLLVRLLPASDACAFSPPLIITEEETNEMFDRFEKAILEAAALYQRRSS